MDVRAPHRSREGSRLFLVFAVASLVPVLVLGVVLGRGTEDTGRAWALAQGREQADVIEQMAVSPALDGEQIGRSLSAVEVQRLRDATDLAIFSGSVSSLRVRSFTGRVVFSDDGSRTDPLAASSAAFRAAVAGRTDVRLVAGSPGLGRVVRVITPVVPSSTGEATGVLEVYLPYAHVERVVRAQTSATYRRLGIGLAALYAVLAFLCWSTTRRLRRFAVERHHESLHDPLTGLPNRAWFAASATSAVESAGRGARGALALVDLNGFKAVNDTHGHRAGDVLLQQVAARLSASLRPGDAVARLGGDEFGILLADVTTAAEAAAVLERVCEELERVVDVDGARVQTAASIGAALYPAHGEDVETLLGHADAAMYRGKGAGRSRVVVHEPEHGDQPDEPHQHDQHHQHQPGAAGGSGGASTLEVSSA